MLRVLVTGAGGFLGARLCRALTASGEEVWALARRALPETSEGVRVLQADATDLAQLRAVFERARPEIVYHLAGHVTTAAQLEHVIPAFNDNLVTAVNAMVCAAQRGCRRFIMAASLEEPEIGDALPMLGSPYAAAKWSARAYGSMFTQLYGLPVVHGRVFLAYGPGQAGSSKLIPYTIESLLSGITPEFKSESRRIDWVYIDDAIEGLIRLATAPGVEGSTVDLGSGTLVSVGDVVRTLFRIMGSSEEPSFAGDTARRKEVERVANAERTRALIGWSAHVGLEEGLARTVAWHRAQLRPRKVAGQL